jgi:glycosyltransferase involved in cell wall biosynthesis
MKGPIAYISHYFPALTQTFVYREVLAMEEAGWRVIPFGIRRPTKGISGDARELASRTRYVAPPRPVQAVAANLRCFLRRPMRYLGVLLHLLSRPGESLAARVHGLTHFFGAMSIVPDLERAGVKHFHAHFGQNPATIAMAAAEYLGVPFSMTIHARDLFVNTYLLRAKLARARFVVTISEYNARLLRQLAGDARQAAKIHVLHCGVDIRRFEPRPNDAPSAPEPAPPVFFAVGRLVEKKGYRYLIEAARLLKDRGVPFSVRVIGGGPDQQELGRQIAALDVADRVRLEGPMPQEQLLPLLRGADAFVLPCVLAQDGDRDGIPVSLMEAMAYGIPCVSTELSGIPELIESGKEGLLVPEKDAPALAGALERLARDAALRAAMGRAARAKVEAQFTMQGLVRGLEELLE